MSPVLIIVKSQGDQAWLTRDYSGDRRMIAGAVVELGGLGAGVVGDGLCVLDGAAAFEVGGDAGGPEGVEADGFGQARRLGTGFDHSPGIVAVYRSVNLRRPSA